jgi:hypothetical protein
VGEDALKDFQMAVTKAIEESHKLGLPAYQREGNYIIALYPGGKKVKVKKILPPYAFEESTGMPK